MESSYAAPLAASRWRTATFVVAGLAALELAALVAIGVAVLGRSVAHQVKDAAYAKAASVPTPTVPKQTAPGAPKLTRSETGVLVLNGSGVAGAAGAEAARLARDAKARIVTPLDGMRREALLGAQVVIVVGN